MERFHYNLKQKIQIVDMAREDDLFRLNSYFPLVTPKQVKDWDKKYQQMESLSEEKKANSYTLHTGPQIKYKELYHYLYQKVKSLRGERIGVTAEYLLELAIAEQPEIQELTVKGQQSLIRRFLSYFGLTMRQITSTSGYRPEQLLEDQTQAIEHFKARYRQIITQQRIKIDDIFNMDQTMINYENVIKRTVDYQGVKEVTVATRGSEKKRATLFSLLSCSGELLPQLVVFKASADGNIKREVQGYDEFYSIHTTQANGWCDKDVLLEWVQNIWFPFIGNNPNPKLLILDSYPLHREIEDLLSRYNCTVMYIPAGLTFCLQPLDAGFHKLLKDELRRCWVRSQGIILQNEKEKRKEVADNLKSSWQKLAYEGENSVFWKKAGLEYPTDDINYAIRRSQIQMEEEGIEDLQGSARMDDERLI